MPVSFYPSTSPTLVSAAHSPLATATEHTSSMEPFVTTRLSLHVPSLFQRVHQNPKPTPRKHERYYFADGNVIFLVPLRLGPLHILFKCSFQVEDTLYNLHRYFFQQYSASFVSILSHSLGRWDDKPIPLTGVTVKDFDLFLSIPYPA
jgi:hypothetical protein